MYEIPGPRGNNSFRIESQHAQLVAREAVRLAPVPGIRRSQYLFTLWELAFPKITVDRAATVTVINDSTTSPGPRTYAWQAPSDATATQTCTFTFTRNAGSDISSRIENAPTRIGTTGVSASPITTPPAATQPATTKPIIQTPAAAAGGVGIVTGATPDASRLASATADLALAVTASDPTTTSVGSWPAGGTARYIVSLTNNGPAAGDGARLVVPADGSMTKTLVICTAASGARCPAAVTVADLENGVAIPALPSRGTVTLEYVAGVWAASGTVTATATVNAPAGTPDPNPANNTATQTQSIAPRSTAGGSSTAPPGSRATATDLAIYIETDPRSVTMWAPNSTAKYRIFVTNWGPLDASGAVLNVPPTPGLVKTMVACSTSIPFQNNPTLTPGQCPASVTVNQLENGVVIPGLRVGDRVAFTLEARVTAALGASVSVSGAIIPPAGVIELVYDASNNTSTNTIPVVVPSTDAGIAGRVATGGNVIGTPSPTGLTMADCRLPGPSVTTTAVSLTGLSLAWPHINGATYTVSRSDMGMLTASPLTSAVYPATIGFSQGGPLYHHLTYDYTVIATYGGGCGRTTLPINPPRPFRPTLTASLDIPIPATGEHFVRLGWRVPEQVQPRNGDNHGFLLFGPGLPPGGKSYSGCGATDCSLAGPEGLPWWVELTTAPPGNQTWLLAPFWVTSQGQLLDFSSAASVTLTVPPVK
jgi:hypothetical protein